MNVPVHHLSSVNMDDFDKIYTVMRRDFSLSHRGWIYSFLLRIQYTKLQCCSFETLCARWEIRDYSNRGFTTDKITLT